MARSITPTLLSIDEWAALIGIDPWTINQIGTGFPDGSVVGISNSCQNIFFQDEWQNEYLSREEIGKAIANAEDLLAKRLQFYPAPKYIYAEQKQYPYQLMPYSWGSGAWGNGGGSWWQNDWYPYGRVPSVQLQFTKVLGGGVLARTLIGNAAVVLSDSDGDGVDDTFTATIATTITDASEIGAYFLAADRVPTNDGVDETWRLRPVTVTISGGNATIVGHSALLVLPALETGVLPQVLDVTDPLIYATQITVYRVYRDSDQSGTAYWEQLSNCTDDTIPPCDLTTQDICIGDRNGARGQVFISFTGDDCCTQWRAPDKVSVNYLAGVSLVNGRMDSTYARMVAYLACGLLPVRKCGCEQADRIVAYWRQDMGITTAEGASPAPLTAHEMMCPFGTSRGALYAWNRIPENENLIGVSI